MNIRKLLTIILSTAILFSATVKPVAGQYGQYGEVEVEKKISIDKKVKHPEQTTKGGEDIYVDNLFASQYLFDPDQEVKFKITITNPSNEDLVVNVKDILPLDYLFTYDSMDFSIDSDTSDLNAEIELKAGESKDLYFIAKVVSVDKLPSAGGYYCFYNTAQAWIEGDNVVYQDTAQICVAVEAVTTKGGLPVIVKKIPEAGPAENLTILLGSGILGLTGFVLMKKKA